MNPEYCYEHGNKCEHITCTCPAFYKEDCAICTPELVKEEV